VLNVKLIQEPAALITQHGLPHVTWCTTGKLAFLPIHAAGIYRGKTPSGLKAYERIVSSYTPTLSALSHASAPSTPLVSPTTQLGPVDIVVVSQPNTPGFSPLPGTTLEVERVRAHFSRDEVVHLDNAAATVDIVLESIVRHAPRFVHLACHGIQDAKQPLNSSFVMYDKQLPLSVLISRTATNAELAFLSACQTASGDKSLPEESVHLAGGMFAAGFKSVIGTMWSIGDEDAPLIADGVYARLTTRDESIGSEDGQQGPAYALHEAVGRLRSKVGERNFLRWVPFVHFGR